MAEAAPQPTQIDNSAELCSTGTKNTDGTDNNAVSTMTTAPHSPVGTGVHTAAYTDENDGGSAGTAGMSTTDTFNTPVAGFSVDANSISFGNALTPESWHRVPVKYSGCASMWECLGASDMLRNWLAHYLATPAVVKSIEVMACGGDHCDWAVIVPVLDIADAVSLSVSTSDKILLQRTASVPDVGVLVILRCAHTNRPDDDDTYAAGANRQGTGNNSWMRDIVLFSVVNRPAVGMQERFEILKGTFDENSEFASPQADDLHEVLGIKIHKDDLFPMTQTEVAPAPACLSQTLDLYLYRRNISTAQYASLQQHDLIKINEPQDTDATPVSALNRLKSAGMSEAWRMTSDATSMAALFLFHEYRYYRLMPRYQPPRDVVAVDTTIKQKPLFTTVARIEPQVASVNLKVRIVVPREVQQASPVVAPSDSTDDHAAAADDEDAASRSRSKDTFCVVGDDTGTIKLRLVGGPVEYPAALYEVGTNITLRNAVVNVVDQRLLVSMNKWGKLLVVEDATELQTDFSFEVRTDNDMSAVEYELVPSIPRKDNGGPQGNMRGRQRYGSRRGMRNTYGGRGNRR